MRDETNDIFFYYRLYLCRIYYMLELESAGRRAILGVPC